MAYLVFLKYRDGILGNSPEYHRGTSEIPF